MWLSIKKLICHSCIISHVRVYLLSSLPRFFLIPFSQILQLNLKKLHHITVEYLFIRPCKCGHIKAEKM